MGKFALLMICSILFSGCSGYLQETKRYKMTSMEGRYHFDDPIKLEPEEALDVIERWLELGMNPENSTIEKSGTPATQFVVTGLAPVEGRSVEEYCRYRMIIRIADKKLNTQFETLKLTDQFYPSKNNIKKLKNYYEKIHKDLKKTLDEVKK